MNNVVDVIVILVIKVKRKVNIRIIKGERK